MSPRPVYNSAPRSHAGSCPCARCVQVRRNRNGSRLGCGILFPVFIGVAALFWPAAVWHGCKYGESTCGAGSEWVWDGRTWIACGIWWGICILPVAAALVAKAAGKRAARSPRPPGGRLC